MEALLKEDISSASGRMLLSDNLWSQGLSRAVRRALCHTCFPMSGRSTILNGSPSVTNRSATPNLLIPRRLLFSFIDVQFSW